MFYCYIKLFIVLSFVLDIIYCFIYFLSFFICCFFLSIILFIFFVLSITFIVLFIILSLSTCRSIYCSIILSISLFIVLSINNSVSCFSNLIVPSFVLLFYLCLSQVQVCWTLSSGLMFLTAVRRIFFCAGGGAELTHPGGGSGSAQLATTSRPPLCSVEVRHQLTGQWLMN